MIAKAANNNTNASANATARRTLWMAARARNAAKRGGLIATVGLLAVISTMLVLMMVPREADRAVRERIAAFPPLTDTLLLKSRAESTRARQKVAESSLRALRNADADKIADAAKNSPAVNETNASSAPSIETDARRDLGVRITRARSAPLVESFRAVGEADYLRSDVRVRALLDSLIDASKQRDASAALGGPDARYAALTAKLSTLGQRILAIAEQRLAANQETPSTAAPSKTGTRLTTAASNADTLRSSTDTLTLAPTAAFNIDSIAERVARSTLDTANARAVAAEQALTNGRKSNVDGIARRRQTEAESTINIPTMAMLLAALAVGLAVGYGVALIMEARQPRIADIAEVERLTEARVIVHGGATRAALNMRHRRQSDDTLFPVIDTVSDAYQLLHVTLTGFGDTAHSVRVIGDSPLISATVGINLAAAAAREARATLMIEADAEGRLASSLLHVAKQKGVAESISAPGQVRSRLVRTKVGRDQYIDTLFAGTTKRQTSRAQSDAEHPAPSEAESELQKELQLIANEHDLTVILSSLETGSSSAILPAVTDAILCVRLGVTKLSWLMRSVVQLRNHELRLRAVLLWTANAPVLK